MNQLWELVKESITYLWPFKIVMAWERGAYYVCGRFWKVMQPGLKIVPPFFTELQIEGAVPTVFGTPLQTITTRDGGTLTFSAAITLELEDIGKAYNRVLNWDETALELASGILAEKLAEVDASRLDPEKRGRLIAACVTELQKELGPYGIKVVTLRFNNFVRNMRVYRLLQS
jgi:regulator of protease activity HflC (stomatin/prohibitin superfamily)